MAVAVSEFTDLNVPARTLLGPGPSMVPPRVYRAMTAPVVGHLDPTFLAVMDDIQALLRMVFQAPSAYTLAISGTGSAGMEAAIANFVEPGDLVVIGVAGYFGERMAEMARRYGGEVERIEVPWGEAITPRQVNDALEARPAKLVAVVHGETSTGVQQPLRDIASVVHRHGALFLVDAVASLAGAPVEMEANDIDICYSGSQKCLSAPPGLAPLALGPRAQTALQLRETPVTSWYLDLKLLQKYWGPERVYHHTAPVSLNYALREALRLIDEEGLENAFGRHADNAHLLYEGLAELDLVPYVAPELRLSSLTTVRAPEGVDEMEVRKRLMSDYNIEIAGGLGALKGKVWRIGLMGYSSRAENVVTLLGALQRILV